MKHLTAIRNPKSKIRNRPAFTMMELMMAIGIFAIGMGLIAGLFPAAVKEAESAVKDYEGPTICQNGLAIVKARVTHTAADTPVGDSLGKLTDAAIVIGDADREFRTYDSNDSGTDDRQRGFTVLAKQWGGRNDYQIAIIAYDVAYDNATSTANDVEPIVLTSSIAELDKNTQTKVQLTGGGLSGAEYMRLTGSPFIDSNSGRYATIQSVVEESGSYYAHLDHPVYEAVSNPIVIVEKDGSVIQDGSPVIGVMMTRTALRD